MNDPSQARISETVSEKPKRGRPPAFPDSAHALAAKMKPDVRTRRGQQNLVYAMIGLNFVRARGAQFAWLFDEAAAQSGDNPRMKWTILSELGRVADEELREALATLLCEQKPTTREAITWIRRARKAHCGKSSAIALADAILRIIDDYQTTHPDTTPQQVFAALEDARTLLAQEERTNDSG